MLGVSHDFSIFAWKISSAANCVKMLPTPLRPKITLWLRAVKQYLYLRDDFPVSFAPRIRRQKRIDGFHQVGMNIPVVTVPAYFQILDDVA